MNSEEKNIILKLKEKPYKIANAVGFKDVKENPHNEWMQELIFGKGDYTLMAHRGSYKSSCLSVCIAILMIIKPTINILFFRKTDTDVSEMLNMVSKALQSKALQNISNIIYGEPVIIIKQNANTITTNLYQSSSGAEQLLGLGIKTSITGKHADLVITDDICNISDRISRAERDKTKTQFMELQNIRNRGGRIVSLGTKWHKDDVFTLMENISTYTYQDTKLINEKQIAKLKQQMTASLFACNYELKIVADDDVIFTSPKTGAEPELVLNGTSHCDAAFYGEDYTAFTICAIHNGKYYVYGRCWRKHIDDVIDECVKLHNDNLCQKLMIEKNADKGYVAKAFKDKGLRVYAYNESQNKYVKITTHLKFEWENVIFVKGTDQEYIDMICDYNENAEHDDACLIGETMIATIKGDVMIKDIKKGDYVITPMGARKVVDCGMTGHNCNVSDYNGVVATSNHKFYDKKSNAFVRADCLTSSASYDIISLKELIKWRRKLLYSMGKNIGEAQRANIISSTQQEIVREKKQNSCIGRCGNTITEKFRKAITFIILTAISTITTLPIWSAYLLGNIYQCTQRKILKVKKRENETESNLRKLLNSQKSGINPKQEKNGTENIQKTAFSRRLFTISRKFVSFAKRNILAQRHKGFVLSLVNAKQERQELINLEQKTDCVKTVGKSMKQIHTNKNIVATNANMSFTRKEDVYNLTVENAGCFYANGVLVSNCDSLASLIREMAKIKNKTPYKSVW